MRRKSVSKFKIRLSKTNNITKPKIKFSKAKSKNFTNNKDLN